MSGTMLHEAEISAILPHLIDKAGHKSERHKLAFKAAIQAAGQAVSPARLNQLLLAGLGAKNKKTRVVCIEEMCRVVEAHGAASLGRAGVREIGAFLDSRDNDALGRNQCLELCHALYVSMGGDLPKLVKLLGELSERSASLVEDRIRQKNKTAAATSTAASAAAAANAAVPASATIAAPTATANSINSTTASAAATPPPTARGDGSSPFRLQMTPPEEANPNPAAALPLPPSFPIPPAQTLPPAQPLTPPAPEAGLGLGGRAGGLGLAPTWTATPGPALNPTPGSDKKGRGLLATPLGEAWGRGYSLHYITLYTYLYICIYLYYIYMYLTSLVHLV